MRLSSEGRPIPEPTPATQPFFDAARKRELLLPRCPRDGFFFYPRSRCPSCLGDDWVWERASGRGEVLAVTIDRIGHDPAMADQVPYAIAIVELREGPRMTARLVGCELADAHVGMAVEAAFEDVEDVTLVNFRPAAA